jgi:hypothetical protein
MVDERDPEGVDIIDARGRYLLGSTEDTYGVWDRRATEGPIATFPGTDDGLDQAEGLYRELLREARRQRDVWSPVLSWIPFVGLGAWIVAGGAYDIVIATRGIEGSAHVYDILQSLAAVEGLSFKVWIGALVVLFSLWLRRNRNRTQQGPLADSALRDMEPREG